MTLLHLLKDELSWRTREEWEKALVLMEQFFGEHGEELAPVKELAERVRRGTDAIDGYIQLNTAEVCPLCEKVCCMNKHGYYDHEDLVYVFSLGRTPTRYREGVRDTDPCQFISQYGCTIERSIRPFRCNWYFCNVLLAHMENGPARPYRAFLDQFQEVVTTKGEMLGLFFRILKEKTGS